jgi:cytoskeletal protein CcmA (bactofilin family)
MANQLGGPAGPAPSTAPPARTAPNSGVGGRRATVGPASAVRGQLSAREDVWIEGQLEGEVQAPAHQVTVSPGGRVRADVKARSVFVEGELVGNVVAGEMVTVRAGGRMQGDIRAPRVGLEEGCQFQGHVDMDGSQAETAPAALAEAPAAAPAEAPAAAPVDDAVGARPALVGEGSG